LIKKKAPEMGLLYFKNVFLDTMTPSHLSDESILNEIMRVFFSGGEYAYVDFYKAATQLNEETVHILDVERLWRKLLDDGLIEVSKKDKALYFLSDKGMELMRKYGTYTTYLESEKKSTTKKDKIERSDRRVKNIGILVTLIISLLTLFLTQFPIRKDKQQKKTEEGIQSVATKLDSLLKVLPQLPTTPTKQPIKDTATNK
jgi:DNA-binding PadR family transcriptional regulator